MGQASQFWIMAQARITRPNFRTHGELLVVADLGIFVSGRMTHNVYYVKCQLWLLARLFLSPQPPAP